MPEIDWRSASREERQILYRSLKAEMDRRNMTLFELLEEALGTANVGHGYDANMRSGRFNRKHAFQFYDWLRRNNPKAAANVAEEILTAEQPRAKSWQELRDRAPSTLERSIEDKLLQKQSYLIIRQIRAEIHEELVEQSGILSEAIVAFADAYDLVHHPEELCNAPWNALTHIAGFICDFRHAPKHGDKTGLDLVRDAKIRSRVKYDTFVKLQSITVSAIRLWEVIKPVWDQIGGDRDLAQDQAKWESSNKIYWLWKQYPVYAALQKKLEDGIVSGRVKAEEIQREVVSALNDSIPGYQDLEQPAWQIVRRDKL
jgi:hypothetical protein